MGRCYAHPTKAEALKRPSAQPITTLRCVCVRACVRVRHSADANLCMMNSLCPVSFSSPVTVLTDFHLSDLSELS